MPNHSWAPSSCMIAASHMHRTPVSAILGAENSTSQMIDPSLPGGRSEVSLGLSATHEDDSVLRVATGRVNVDYLS
jgi:hypothetical protein